MGKKKLYGNILIGMIFTLLGFVITFQMVHMKEDYSFVSLKTISDLQIEANKELSEIKNIRELIYTKNNRLKEYQRAVENEGSIREVLYAEIQNLKTISGFVDLEGPGIIVKLSDSERELYEWEDPNDLIVHNIDVLNIVNELRFAGAEALSINGERVLSNTEIKCTGPTITINNYTFGQPFIIKAIGDPVTLEAAVKSPESTAYRLREYYGLIVESQVSPWVKIPRYKGHVPMNYITAKEGE